MPRRLFATCIALHLSALAACGGNPPGAPSARPERSAETAVSASARAGPANTDTPDATGTPKPTARAGLIDGRFIADGNVRSAGGDTRSGVLGVTVQKATADRDLAVCEAPREMFEMSYNVETTFTPKRVASDDRFPENLIGSRVTVTGKVDKKGYANECAISVDRVEVGT